MTALTLSLPSVLRIEAQRTLGYTRTVEQKVGLVAAEALVFPWAEAAVAGLVALLALAVGVHVGGDGTLAVPHAVIGGIQQAALSTGEAGGGQVVRAGQACGVTFSALVGVAVIVGAVGTLAQTLPPVADRPGVLTHDTVVLVRPITGQALSVAFQTLMLEL